VVEGWMTALQCAVLCAQEQPCSDELWVHLNDAGDGDDSRTVQSCDGAGAGMSGQPPGGTHLQLAKGAQGVVSAGEAICHHECAARMTGCPIARRLRCRFANVVFSASAAIKANQKRRDTSKCTGHVPNAFTVLRFGYVAVHGGGVPLSCSTAGSPHRANPVPTHITSHKRAGSPYLLKRLVLEAGDLVPVPWDLVLARGAGLKAMKVDGHPAADVACCQGPWCINSRAAAVITHGLANIGTRNLRRCRAGYFGHLRLEAWALGRRSGLGARVLGLGGLRSGRGAARHGGGRGRPGA
jgi:hypothetical protein